MDARSRVKQDVREASSEIFWVPAMAGGPPPSMPHGRLGELLTKATRGRHHGQADATGDATQGRTGEAAACWKEPPGLLQGHLVATLCLCLHCLLDALFPKSSKHLRDVGMIVHILQMNKNEVQY